MRKLIHWEEVRDLCWTRGYTVCSKSFIFSEQGSPLRIAFISHSLWSLISLTYNPSFSLWRMRRLSFYPTILSSCCAVNSRSCWSVRRELHLHTFSHNLDEMTSFTYKVTSPTHKHTPALHGQDRVFIYGLKKIRFLGCPFIYSYHGMAINLHPTTLPLLAVNCAGFLIG